MRFRLTQLLFLTLLLACALVWNPVSAAQPAGAAVAHPKTSSKSTSARTAPKNSPKKKTTTRRRPGVPTFADSTANDNADYDDPVVREAAVSALGRYNGSVVAIDPNTGRILTVVNQDLAFSEGFIPCSTIKPVVALAALQENIITRDTMLRVTRRSYMNLT